MSHTAYLHNREDNDRLCLSSKDSDDKNGQNADCSRAALDTGKGGRAVPKAGVHSNHRCTCEGNFFLPKCYQEKLT